MKFSLVSDLLTNTVLPIVIGGFFYSNSIILSNSVFVRNYLPDGLWAYAFISCILIIWNRNINLYWICLGFLSMVPFEGLQYLQIFPGTADGWDIVTYAAFSVLALISNNYFTPNNLNNHHDYQT